MESYNGSNNIGAMNDTPASGPLEDQTFLGLFYFVVARSWLACPSIIVQLGQILSEIKSAICKGDLMEGVVKEHWQMLCEQAAV